MKRKESARLVYSTEGSNNCNSCGKDLRKCRCDTQKMIKGDGIVRIHRETKGRKGSGVSLVKGVDLENSELKKLAKELKKKCGTGGTIKAGVIEIQGDHRDLLLNLLRQKGYTVKLAGG